MQRTNTSNITKMVALALLLAVCAASLPASSVNTYAKEFSIEAEASKVSEDFAKLDKDFNADAILQLNGPMSDALSDFIKKNVSLKESFTNLDAYAIKVKVSFISEMIKFPEVSFITLDKKVNKMGHATLTTGADAARWLGGKTAYDGSGVVVAVLDSGVEATHKSVMLDRKTSNVSLSKDFTADSTVVDSFGHGTHVASAVVGNPALLKGAYGGIAPKARVISLRVLNAQGVGNFSTVLRGLDWVVANRAAYNVRVVNMSLGAVALDSYHKDPLCRAVRRLVDRGTVVVAAAGNSGKDALGNKVYGAIHTPGIEPSAITVGASNTFGTGARNDDGVTTYSSRGPTRSFWVDGNNAVRYDNVIKPDLVAPGNKMVWAQSKNNYIVTTHPDLAVNTSEANMMYLSGTSMAAPLVAGAVALMLQANPKLTPNLVKAILQYTAQPLPGYNIIEQGTGQLNVEGAVRLARQVRTDLSSATPLGDPLLTSSAPPDPYTTIAGETFYWSRRVTIGPTYTATGIELITEYQKVYGLGFLLSDGIVYGDGIVLGDGIVYGDGIVLGDNVVSSDGIVLGDGIMLGDGIVYGDGIVLGDSSTGSPSGDDTPHMR